MSGRAYDAILLDLDGTLVTDADEIRPRTLASLRRAVDRGVRVMVATGRSELATIPVLDTLGFDTPAVVFNGAAVYCPRTRRMLEERLLSERALGLSVDFAVRHGCLIVAMCAGVKYSLPPRNEVERLALRDMTGLVFAPPEALKVQRAIRVTLLSDRHASSQEFAGAIEDTMSEPLYVTHFPLNLLAQHRESRLLVADLHPPCRGKAEALRVLDELYGIAPERVIAVGDATNDLTMFADAGLAVAMASGMPEAIACADRVIGSNNTDAIADLVDELLT
jgi:Cof subfamily protein (haloacid dehalogenase superfamily)